MGIFDTEPNGTFTDYAVTLQFRDKIMGGTPKDPKVIEAWLRTKAGITHQEENFQQMRTTLMELGADLTEESTYEEMVEASKKLALHRQTNGFKRDENGLYLESRIVKAMIKENVHILFAGGKWGPTKKGPKNFISERAFPAEDKIYLGVQEPSGIELFIGHTTGPSGPQSNLTYYEYVERPLIQFTMKVTRDLGDEAKYWPDIWRQAQENGLGSLRSQGFGRFDILQWEKLSSAKKRQAA